MERMIAAKRLMSCEMSHIDRLKGIEPIPAEFHKRGILLQDTMNTFFHRKSAAERGTMYHCKQYFSMNSLQKEVMRNFSHVEDLLHLMTKGNVCLLAMQVLNLNTVDDCPTESPCMVGIEGRKEYLDATARQILVAVWQEAASDVDEVRNATPDWGSDPERFDAEESDELAKAYCLCKEEIPGATMVQCSNGSHCNMGEWFHLECANIEEIPPSTEDWWCSPQCKSDGRSVFCLCKMVKPKLKQVICGAKEQCLNGQLFHLMCQGLKRTPKTQWFCSPECASLHNNRGHTKEDADGVRDYHLQLTFEGLSDMARKDAIKENNGPAMLAFWRIDSLNFWNKNHKHLILAHTLAWYGRVVSPKSRV